MSLTRIITNTAVVTYSYNPAPERPPIIKQMQDTVHNIMLRDGSFFERPQWCPCTNQPSDQGSCRNDQKNEQPCGQKPEGKKPEKEKPEDNKPKKEKVVIYDSVILPVPCRGRCTVDAVEVIPQQVTVDIETRETEGVEQSVAVISGSYIIRVHCLNGRLQDRQFYYRQMFEQVVPISNEFESAEIVSSQITNVLIEGGRIYIDVQIEVELEE